MTQNEEKHIIIIFITLLIGLILILISQDKGRFSCDIYSSKCINQDNCINNNFTYVNAEAVSYEAGGSYESTSYKYIVKCKNNISIMCDNKCITSIPKYTEKTYDFSKNLLHLGITFVFPCIVLGILTFIQAIVFFLMELSNKSFGKYTVLEKV